MEFTIGTDPEIFLKDKETKQIKSVSGILGGTKDEPKSIGKKCKVQEDNILAEFNIPPVKTKEDFLKYINHAKDYISTIAAANGLELHYSSSEMIDPQILDENSEEFGCSPSLNVVSKQFVSVKIEDMPPHLRNLRTSGFHIHFGNKKLTEEQCERLVFAFELMVSLYLAKYDNDKHGRRNFYGKFGDCRIKDYGVECRSLGGFFLKDDDTISMVWDRIEEAISLFNNNSISTQELEDMVNYCVGEDDVVIQANVDEVLNKNIYEKTNK